jgi:hypothetical protein
VLHTFTPQSFKMKLSVTQCLEILKSPANPAFLQLARKQEERLTMHVEAIGERWGMPGAFADFLNWVKLILPADKYARFEQLITFPLETVSLTGKIFDELSKFFDTPDKFTSFQFTSSALQEDFSEYLNDKLNDESFWQEKGFEALKTGINSFLVVDVPATQRSLRPEPYYYLASSFSVWDVVLNQETGVVEYLAICQKDGSIVVIDEIAWRRFVKPEQGDWVLADGGEAIHSRYSTTVNEAGVAVYGDLIEGLGYVPACSFYEHSIKGSRRINKKGPLSGALSKLHKLLFKIVSQDYFELYGSYPVTVAYAQKCEYRDKDGNECNEGFVNSEYFDTTTEKHCKEQRACPVCSAKKGLMGPGTFFEVDPPKDKADVDLMVNPIKFIEPSTQLLEFGVDKIEALKREIILDTTGLIDEATKEAINEKQVNSQYEGRKAILNRIREQFDATRKFALETVARLRYGRAFVSASVFGGQEYFLQTADDIANQYANGKKIGLPSYEIARIRESLIETKYRNNPSEKSRAMILAQLEPYPDLTLTDLKANGIDIAEPAEFLLKLDFISFINQFEREQINVVEFGSLIAFDTKIETIKSVLLGYAEARVAKYKKPEPTKAPVL